jgi:hypothetical protein
MLEVLFWSLFALALLIVIPDSWHARREIARRQEKARLKARRESRRAHSRVATRQQAR